MAGPKDYVKYTDGYQTRSHINFDDGTITVETIAGTEPAARLRQAIINTLLMGDDRVQLTFTPMPTIPHLERAVPVWQVVDNNGKPFAGKAARPICRLSAANAAEKTHQWPTYYL
ncbi:murein transglycosylase domain-containing protein [Shigella flexneri]